MEKNGFLKLLFVFVFSTMFIFSAVYYGSRAYADIFEDEVYPEGTSIASHSIAGLTRQQAFDLLESEISGWMTETVMVIQYKEKKSELANDLFLFDLTATLNDLQNGQYNQIKTLIDHSKLEEELLALSGKIDLSQVDFTGLNEELTGRAALLQSDSNVQLLPFMTNENPNAELATVVLPAGDALMELTNLVNDLKMIEIKEQSTFSLLNFADTVGSRTYSSETLSILASGIYRVILETNFEVVERHISSEKPIYAQLGFEANVAEDFRKDFVFANHNVTSYSIELSIKDSQLIVKLKGYPFLYEYTMKTKGAEKFKQETIVQFDPKLAFGDMQIIEAGYPGEKITIVRETKDEFGKLLKEVEIASDFYSPVHRKEIRSLMSANSGAGDTAMQEEYGNKNTSGEQPDAEQADNEGSDEQDANTSNAENNQQLSVLKCLENPEADATVSTLFDCELILKNKKEAKETEKNGEEVVGRNTN